MCVKTPAPLPITQTRYLSNLWEATGGSGMAITTQSSLDVTSYTCLFFTRVLDSSLASS